MKRGVFMGSVLLSARCTSNTITVFWDKPESANAGTVYEVSLNGGHSIRTDRTHYTFTELLPNTEYCITVHDVGDIRICTSPARRRIYVTEAPYHAVGDGKTLNTAALQKAFTDCGPNDEVYFPSGIYLTGALDLHSCMAVYLEEGAVLQGSSDPTDYLPRIWSRFEGTEQECYRSLLNAGQLDHAADANCEDILLYGKGTISGGGHVLAERMIEIERENLREYLAQNAALVATCENDRTIPGRVRGRLIHLSNCSRIRITGLTLQNGAAWNVHMIYCDDIVTDHCTLRSSGIWNGDGWYPDFHYVEDYFSRIHAALDGAMADTGLLVINPIESVWARAYCGAFNRLEAQDSGIRLLEKAYASVFTILEAHQLDFDYGDEDILSRHVKVKDGVLSIGPCRHDRIVVAGLDTMRSSTLELLSQFASQGGKVIFAGELPGYVDALPSTAPAALAEQCIHVPFEENALASACATGHEVKVISDNTSQIYARSYIGSDSKERWVMLLNHDEKAACPMQVSLGDGASVERWDPRTGAVTTPAAVQKDGSWVITLTLEPGGERLYRLPASARDLPAEPDYTPGRAIPLPAAFRYRLTEPNVCVLDRVVVTAPGEPPLPEQDVLMADNALRDFLKLPYRKRGMLQPWYQEKFLDSAHDFRGQITIKYTVDVQTIPTKVMLAVEDLAHLCNVTVNDVPLDLTSCGHWIDICYDRLSIPDTAWKTGTNEIVLKMDYYPTSGIEAAFLLGDFGVSFHNGIPALETLPELLTADDIVFQGLPFYSGRIDYLLDTPVSGDALVTIREYGGALTKLFGSKETIVAFPPYQAAIPDLHTIEVVLSRRNTFGPLHKEVAVGDSSHTLSEAELSAYRPYLLEPQGLLALPVVAELSD